MTLRTVTYDTATHKIVPICPTAPMLDDGEVFASNAKLCWQEMVNAAPVYMYQEPTKDE